MQIQLFIDREGQEEQTVLCEPAESVTLQIDGVDLEIEVDTPGNVEARLIEGSSSHSVEGSEDQPLRSVMDQFVPEDYEPVVQTQNERSGSDKEWDTTTSQCSECHNYFLGEYNYCPRCGDDDVKVIHDG